MKKALLFFLLPCLSLAWGRLGHEITAKIAEIHLKPNTKIQIKKLMGNSDLASISNWLDEIRPTRKFISLHYATMDEKQTLMHEKYSGELHQGILDAIATLKNKKLSQTKRQEALKILVHLAGDAHQPLHVGNGNDMGGNLCYVFWFKRKQPVSLHKIWDNFLVKALYKASPLLVTESLNVASIEEKNLETALPIIWLQESRAMHSKIYPKKCSSGIHFSENYVQENTPIVRQRLVAGGIRLAGILNTIFTANI